MTDVTVATFDPASEISAASVVQGLALSDEARALLEKGINVRRFLDALVEGGLSADALAVVARALPKRYVIAWACDCMKNAFAADPTVKDIDRAGLALAQQWLADPSEERRRAAFEFAERDELASPGAWIAASAGWSGGSLAPRGYDPIPPPDHLPAEAAVAALRFVAARKADYATAINGFIARALQLFGSAATRPARTTGAA